MTLDWFASPTAIDHVAQTQMFSHWMEKQGKRVRIFNRPQSWRTLTESILVWCMHIVMWNVAIRTSVLWQAHFDFRIKIVCCATDHRWQGMRYRLASVLVQWIDTERISTIIHYTIIDTHLNTSVGCPRLSWLLFSHILLRYFGKKLIVLVYVICHLSNNRVAWIGTCSTWAAWSKTVRWISLIAYRITTRFFKCNLTRFTCKAL